MNPWVASISIAYLLGSIPFGYILVRLFRREDVRQQGSGNIGATNVARSGGTKLGVVTLLLDIGKAYAAVVIARHLAPGVYDVQVAAAVAAVVGHVFPVWLGFRGGKGVATGLGSFLLIAPKCVLVAAGIFIVVVAIFRYVSLGSIVAVAAFPILLLIDAP